MKLRWLLFKQGFKSMFRFKLQFIIIMLLSFLSSFYLVATFSTNIRINSLYTDVITDKGKVFDYMTQKNMGGPNSTSNDASDIYIEMNDFVNDNFVSTRLADGSTSSTATNFMLKNNEGLESFVTKAFASNEWKEIFASQYLSLAATDADRDNDYKHIYNPSDDWQGPSDNNENESGISDLGDFLTRLTIKKDTGEINYGPLQLSKMSSLNESFDLGPLVTGNVTDRLKRFTSMTTGVLMNSFITDLKDKKQNLSPNDPSFKKLPLAYQYYLTDDIAYNDLMKNVWDVIQYPSIHDDTSITTTDWYKNRWYVLDGTQLGNMSRTDLSPEIHQIRNNKNFVYLYTAFNSLSYELLNEIMNFEQNAWSMFSADASFGTANAGQNRGQKLSENYSKFYNNLSLIYTDNMSRENIDSTEMALSQHMVTDYEYLFGENLIQDGKLGALNVNDIPGLKKDNNDIDVVGQNSKFSFVDSASYKQNMTFGATYDLGDMKNYDKFKFGLRGMTNPISYSLNSKNQPVSLNVNESYDMLGRYDIGKSFSASRGGIEYDYDKFDTSITYTDPKKWTASQASILAMEKMHHDMAAEVTNFTLNFREEANLYDSTSKVSYRFVILDENESKNGGQYLKLIEGTMPTTANQILIGEQFAFKNKLKMGQTINIGGVRKIVSGYATDTLSYYPLTNLDVPSPDIKNGAIVYLTKQSLRSLSHTAGISDSLAMKNYYFTTKKANVSDEEMLSNIKLYNALTNTNLKKMNVAYDILQKNNTSIFWDDEWQNNSGISTFKSTPFYNSWTIQPLFSKTMKLLAIIISGLILILSFIAISFGIRKNIQANTSQIACMKSIGVRSYELAFSYVSYSIIIGLIVVPFAWIIGGMAQELIVRMFMQYICTPLFQFIFSWKILLALMLLMGGVTFIFSAIISILYNRQKISKIINGSFVTHLDYKDKKHPLFDRLSFSSRFDLKIARRSIGSLISVAATTLILTTLITSFTFLPTMFSKYISDSEKFFKYDNSYLSNSPYANSPLSAPAIDAWSGADYLESVNRGSEMVGTEMQDYAINYFPSIAQFGDSDSNSSLLPTFKMTSTSDNMSDFDKNVAWTGEYLYSKKDESVKTDNIGTTQEGDKPPYQPNNSLLMMILNTTLEKAANLNGFSLSMGDLEQYAMMPMYTVKNTNGSNENFVSTEERRQALVQSMSALKDGIPNLLETIFPEVSNIPKSNDWRKSLFYLLETYLPSEITSNLVSDTKTSEFNLATSAENFVPGRETLGTYAKIKDSNGKTFGIDGLKSNQLVYRLTPDETKNVFLSDDNIKKLADLFDGKSIENIVGSDGNKIYDKKTETLYIPSVVNKSVNKSFNFDKPITPTETNYLSLPEMNGRGFVTNVLPKGAWVYDDRDYNEFKNANASKNQSEEYLDPFGMQSSNFDFERQYKRTSDGKIQLLQDTNVFEQLKFDENGNPSWEIRPFYNYNNMRIYIPKLAVPGGALGLTNGSSVDVSTKVSNNDSLSNQNGWYGDVNNNDVPDMAKNAWKNIYSGSGDIDNDQWFWVAPYNLKYNKLYNGNNPNNRFGEMTLTDFVKSGSTLTFGVENIGSNDQYAIRTNNGALPLENSNIKIKEIKLEKESVLKTYNDSVIVADQDLINLLMGYTTDKFLPMDFNPFSKPVSTYELNNGKKYNTYNFKTIDDLKNTDPSSLIYGLDSIFKGDNGNAAKYYGTQDKWYNMKYSGYKEPTSITGGIKTILNGGIGFSNTAAINNVLSNFTSSYKEVSLSSLRVGLIISISRIILSVSIFSILGVIVISILFLMLLSDSFIARYARFMLVMKALGYTKWRITKSIIGIQVIVSLVMIALGIILGDQIIRATLNFSTNNLGLNIPHVVFWWLPIAIIAGIASAFATAFGMSLSKSLKEKPYQLFKE